MCELLELTGDDTVLDVGPARSSPRAGAAGASRVLDRGARIALAAGRPQPARGGVENVTLVVGDDSRLPDHAPYEAINVAAAAGGSIPHWPSSLLGGRLVAPVEDGEQRLVVARRTGDGVTLTGSSASASCAGGRMTPLPIPPHFDPDSVGECGGCRTSRSARPGLAGEQAWARPRTSSGSCSPSTSRTPSASRTSSCSSPAFRDRRRRRQPPPVRVHLPKPRHHHADLAEPGHRAMQIFHPLADRRGRQPPGALHARRRRTMAAGDGA